jgi:hypothetical protein
MKTILQGILFAGFMCCTPISTLAGENLENPCVAEEYQIGVMVKRIAEAIDAPRKPESLQAIAKYGTDSRYYVMTSSMPCSRLLKRSSMRVSWRGFLNGKGG